MATERRWREWLNTPVDGAGLALVRIVFGLVMATAMLRFLAKGWVASFYTAPEFHFTYAGFGWIRPLPPGWMEALVGLAALAACALALGWRTRLSALVFTLAFSWIELCDVSTYLNHYYLVSLLGVLFCVLPSGARWSLDRRRSPVPTVCRWHYLALRIQVGIVYTAAAIAKLQPDWLVEGLPLRLWLPRHADVPVIGPLLAQAWVAIVASWCGMLYDASIPWLLSWRRSRAIGYFLVVVFHLATWLLFPIGMFPWIMIAVSLVFLPPATPRRWLAFLESGTRGLRRTADHRQAAGIDGGAGSGLTPPTPLAAARGPRVPSRALVPALVSIHLLLQALLPFRHLLHPGDVHWHEQGFRFSWRVMIMEKTGFIEYRLIDRHSGHERRVDPAGLLAPHQLKQLETQPDLILAFAHTLAARERAAGKDVAVHAEAWASLNGGAPRRLIDPDIDLSSLAIGWNRSAYVTALARH